MNAVAATGVEHDAVAKPSRGTRPRLRVLAIDDEPRFLESLRLALEETHHVETQTRAPDAVELLQADPARSDIVLCDLSMPGMDGGAFYALMVELGIADRFVLMTGGAFAPPAADFVRSGVCPSISKPFMLERLLALLDQVAEDRCAG